MISSDLPCCSLGGTTPPREAKNQKVCDVSANRVHRAASWFKLLMRVSLSQDSSSDSIFLPASPGRKAGQAAGAWRSNHLKARWAGTGLTKLLLIINLKGLILMPCCMKQSQLRGTPPKFNSYQRGIKNTPNVHTVGALSSAQVGFWAGFHSSLEDFSFFSSGWGNLLLYTCNEGFLQCTPCFGEGREVCASNNSF